jgi:hypothetical protein
MSKQIHDWIVQQIQAHSVVRASAEQVATGDPAAMVRLIDAAAALRDPSGQGQPFGLALPTGGLDAASGLADACIVEIRAWASRIDPRWHSELAGLLASRGLPPLFAPEAVSAPVCHLHVFVAASVEELETDEPVTDAATLAALDGTGPVSPLSLVELPCVASVFASSVVGGHPWAQKGRAVIVFDSAQSQLRCRLTFDLAREPTDSEIARLGWVVENELFYTGWGTNLDWALGADHEHLRIQTGTRVHSHELTRP